MSTTAIKRPLAQAMADAEAFRDLFPPACYEHWQFAGSLRRGRSHVGDIEHVVVPRFGDIEITTGLFAETEHVNLLWHRLDELVRTYALNKHAYGGEKPGTASTTRWGEKYRGVDFRSCCHEIWTAEADNLGSVLAIRTGPGGYSRMLVTLLQRQGYWQNKGHVWKKSPLRCGCGWTGAWVAAEFAKPKPGDPKPLYQNGDGEAVLCPRCLLGNRLELDRVPVPDEQTYFRLCGLAWCEPCRRFDPEDKR